MAVLTSLRICFNFEGVTHEIGRYPFAKILMNVGYIQSWVINSLYNAMSLNRAMNLWNSDVNLMNLHKAI